MQTADTEVLIDVHVRRARLGRLTGWIVQCDECGNVTVIVHKKATANKAAQDHAIDEHDGKCRIFAPVKG